jgi:type IX secretion system PorP/SprF family membrane protein
MLLSLSTQAQQDKQLTHFNFDRMSFNPAITGFKGYCGTIIYRNQWDRVQDAPNTTVLNFQGNLQNLNTGPGNLGVGVSFANDAIGDFRSNTVNLNGAYHFKTPVGKFSAGIGLGIMQMAIDGEWVPPSVPIALDPTISNLANKISETQLDWNIGIHYSGKLGYVGFSATHMAQEAFSIMNYKSRRHYYFLAGTHIPLNLNRPVVLKPAVLLKADGSTMIFDLNLVAEHHFNPEQSVWLGATYRYADGISMMTGLNLGNLKFGYSFDWMTNPLKKWGHGSHELMLNYCLFPAPRPITKTNCPHILW